MQKRSLHFDDRPLEDGPPSFGIEPTSGRRSQPVRGPPDRMPSAASHFVGQLRRLLSNRIFSSNQIFTFAHPLGGPIKITPEMPAEVMPTTGSGWTSCKQIACSAIRKRPPVSAPTVSRICEQFQFPFLPPTDGVPALRRPMPSPKLTRRSTCGLL
jgi:hypothetical protein